MKSNIKFFVRLKRGARLRRFKPIYRSLSKRRSDFYVWNRSAVIVKSLAGKRAAIYNGRSFISVMIRPSMVGHRFGEFSRSKKPALYSKGSKKASGSKRGKKG